VQQQELEQQQKQKQQPEQELEQQQQEQKQQPEQGQAAAAVSASDPVFSPLQPFTTLWAPLLPQLLDEHLAYLIKLLNNMLLATEPNSSSTASSSSSSSRQSSGAGEDMAVAGQSIKRADLRQPRQRLYSARINPCQHTSLRSAKKVNYAPDPSRPAQTVRHKLSGVFGRSTRLSSAQPLSSPCGFRQPFQH